MNGRGFKMKNVEGIVISALAAPGMPMQSPPAAPANKPSTWAIIGLVGGILALVGVLLPWISVSALIITVNFTGLDIMSNALWNKYMIYPVLTLIFGLLALVLCIMRKKMLYLGGGIMGILAFILPLVFMIVVNGDAKTNVTGYGVYLSMVGGILALVGGILGFVKTPKA
jgi:uncharacterized membrane protein YphA (DoxX/SURF4 family)